MTNNEFATSPNPQKSNFKSEIGNLQSSVITKDNEKNKTYASVTLPSNSIKADKKFADVYATHPNLSTSGNFTNPG